MMAQGRVGGDKEIIEYNIFWDKSRDRNEETLKHHPPYCISTPSEVEFRLLYLVGY